MPCPKVGGELRNSAFGILLIASTLIGIGTFYKTYKRRSETKSAFWLLFLIVSAVLWNVAYALFYLLPEGDLAIFFVDLRYVFVMTSGILVFIFVYRTLNRQMLKRRVLWMFLLFAVIDLILVLANGQTGVFISYSGFIDVKGIRALAETDGPGFFYHCIFSYIPLLMAAVGVSRRYIRLPKKYGRMLGWLFFGMIIVFAMTLLAVLNLLPYPIDLAPFGVQITLLMFYHALFNSKSMDIMFISRDIIFENTGSVILVLDTDSLIVDFNKQADEVAKRIQITELIGMHCEEFIEKWQKSSHSYVFEEDQSIFSIVENEKDYHYQIQTNKMIGINDYEIGSYMEIKNISPIMSLIHMLQDAAYYDGLTGLPNRNLFIKKSIEIDTPESLPLCVIVGDVNELKSINDTYGHVKGDTLLKWIAAVLIQCAPDGATIFRMGGDEFVGLLPRTTEEDVEEYTKRINDCIAGTEDLELKTGSIALGYKIKTVPEESIEDLMKAADYEMYTTKRNRRSRNESPVS